MAQMKEETDGELERATEDQAHTVKDKEHDSIPTSSPSRDTQLSVNGTPPSSLAARDGARNSTTPLGASSKRGRNVSLSGMHHKKPRRGIFDLNVRMAVLFVIILRNDGVDA